MNPYRLRVRMPGTTLGAVALGMALLMSGCGGSEDAGDKGSPQTQSGSGNSEATDPQEQSGGNGGDYCDLIRAQLSELNEESMNAAVSPDRAVRQAWFDKQNKLNDEALEAAPAEIRNDLELQLEVTRALAEATFINSDPEAMTAASNRLASPEVSSAIQRVGEYNEDECGITMATPGP